METSRAIELAIRYLLVSLFFPFSALDKALNFDGAVSQAKEMVPADKPAKAMILAGLAVGARLSCYRPGWAAQPQPAPDPDAPSASSHPARRSGRTTVASSR